MPRPARAFTTGSFELEGRAVLSGASHTAAVIGHKPAVAAATAKEKETALLPPAMIKSYLQRSGDTVTGLVMVFSKPLDPATARDVNTYQVSRTVTGHGFYAGAPVGASAAAYDPGQVSVTLTLAQPFKLTPAPLKDTFFVGLTPGSMITDTSGNALVYAGTSRIGGKPILSDRNIAEFVAKGPSPSPFFHTFDQSRINKLLSKNATPKAIAAAAAARSREAPLAAATAASNAAYLAQQAAAAAAFAAGPKIQLTGTIQGTYSTSTAHFQALGGDWSYLVQSTNGTGSISPLGQVTEEFSGVPWDPRKFIQYLPTDQGGVKLSLDLHPAGANRVEGTYTIQGGPGGGPYQWATGSGHVVITWTGDRSRGDYTEVYS